jgi:AmiR/NasT family two-component response regulator
MTQCLRIAVADDEALIRRYFQEVLADMGHTVTVAAENGRQLVEACRADPPDMVISDIRMPQMDGIEAALAICQQTPVPIILVSAFHDADLIERAEGSHAMAYLIKPIGRPDLETAVAIARRRFQHIKSLADESSRLRQSLEDRKTIEKAKGLLMKASGMSEEEAFRRMQQMACDRNLKLIDIAQAILAAGPVLGMIKRR